MAFEMPLDQIKQLQILLRKQANLSWYESDNDAHSTLPKLPSLAETIAHIDPSPPYLRCKVCNGRLLRGLQSSVCVFCGTNPHNKDLPPDPIKFNNTIGYRWLLESLQLDGLEMVAPIVDENASKRGRSETKDEIPLSELLDLEIRWPSEAERFPPSNSDEVAFQVKSSLNLGGVDLDSFFDRRESESDVFEQRLASSGQVGNASDNAFQANENLSLFENFQDSNLATASTEDQSGDSLSGWEANFKSASSAPVHEESKSFYHVTVDLDTVSGSQKDFVGVKKNTDLNATASTENDWFQGDGWRTSNLEVPNLAGKSESTMDLHDTKTAESASGSSTRNFDWMQDDQWQGSDNKTPDIVATGEAADSSDVWSDFTGSASPQYPSSVISSSKITNQAGKFEITADLNDTNTEQGAYSSSIKNFHWMQDGQWQNSNNKTTDTLGTNKAADSFDAWNDFTGSANTQYSSPSVSNSEITGQTGKSELTKDPNDTKGAESATGSSGNFDWMQDNQRQGSNKKANDIVTTDEISDSVDAWNDFTGSTIREDPSSSVSNLGVTGQNRKSELNAALKDKKATEGANSSSIKNFDWMQDDQLQDSNNKTTDTSTTNEGAYSFDIFNGFTSLATTQDLSSSVWKQTVNQTSSAGQTSEMNLLSSLNNSQDMDLGGISLNDLFVEQFSNPQISSGATNAQSASSSNRAADVDTTTGNSGDVSPAKLGSEVGDAEMLMSQMHDLSFMLESNLSIPPK